MKLISKPVIILGALLLFASVIFFKNAWVSEDAYINFRSLEQLIAGNGPLWNPHERVQAFTSPLWFWLLALVRVISTDVFLNAIFLSFLLWMGTLIVFYKLAGDLRVFSLGLLLFITSNAFFDYTSSGLENVLGYFLITVFLSFYLEATKEGKDQHILEDDPKEKKSLLGSLIAFGLIICVRHDLLLLVLPATIYLIWTKRKLFSLKIWLLILGMALLPFILWSLFSTLYYGFPLPNTAYAKLGTQINRIVLAQHGLTYFLSTIKFDLITLVLIAFSIVISISARKKTHLMLCLGIVFSLLYIISIGGDFMRGRFFSYAFLISTILIAFQTWNLKNSKLRNVLIAAVFLYSLFYPHTPLNSPLDYHNDHIVNGIADERGYYFPYLAFNRYVASRLTKTQFPQHFLCEEGKRAPLISVSSEVGM